MLSRLTLTVSQACNLRCVYCYADGGGYGMPSRMMEPELAVASVQRAASKHPVIENIQFFGGEPLTNLPAMEAAADAALALVDSGRLARRPKFSLVTNLTPLDEPALDFLRRRRVHVVASLDGPADIHDALRPSVKGRGTHATVIANLEKLRAAGLAFDLVTTYTPRHWLSGHAVYGLLDYLDGFGPGRVDVVNAAVNGDADLDPTLSPHWPDILHSHQDAIDRVIGGLAHGRFIPHGLVIDLIRALKSETRTRSDALCPAGRTNLAIAADGTPYPCHMLIGAPPRRGRAIPGGAPREGAESDTPCPGKSELEACRSCWAKPWCTMCIGKLAIHRGADGAPLVPVARLCEFSKMTLSTVFAALPVLAERLRGGGERAAVDA